MEKIHKYAIISFIMGFLLGATAITIKVILLGYC